MKIKYKRDKETVAEKRFSLYTVSFMMEYSKKMLLF